MFCPFCSADNEVELIFKQKSPTNKEKVANCPRCKKTFQVKEWENDSF